MLYFPAFSLRITARPGSSTLFCSIDSRLLSTFRLPASRVVIMDAGHFVGLSDGTNDRDYACTRESIFCLSAKNPSRYALVT